MADYCVYDVFTNRAFGGNQLAVFPDARDIPEAMLQNITAEFNFSEVTFVYPPEDPKNTARVRIFTPTTEVDFAGHPVIGTLCALRDLGYGSPMTLELGIGPLHCTIDDGLASFTTTAPLERFAEPDPALIARCLELSVSAIDSTRHAPIQAGLGLPFVLVALKTREDLATCRPFTPAFVEGASRYPTGLDFAVFAYIREGDIIHARMFAPLDNITEDPATGSASAALAGLLTDIAGAPQTLTFYQGEDMGRPSTIHAATTVDPLQVKISGRAVQTMAGRFIL